MTTNNVSDALLMAAIGCPHTIKQDVIVLHFDSKQEGHNALNQLGRRLDAALQSQDREDAERYRWLRKHWFTMTSCYDGGRVEFTTGQPRYSSATEANVDEAIDHARENT